MQGGGLVEKKRATDRLIRRSQTEWNGIGERAAVAQERERERARMNTA